VTDIILGSFGLLGRVKSWEVSSEPSLLDHRHNLFTLHGSLLVSQITNPRGKTWDSFQQDLMDRLGSGPEMNLKDEAGLGLAILWDQHALTQPIRIIVLLDMLKQADTL
jgi:hypothetical protein